MRERRNFPDPLPMRGDKLVCLRNNKRKGLFNGGLWLVHERPRLRRQPLLSFFVFAHLFAMLLFALWGAYWGGLPEFSQVGLIG